ncbi:MAG: alpha/beta hydrolase [Pseudomonadota bacterium]
MRITTPDDVAAVAARATRHETPCGDGAMVWRRWRVGSETSGAETGTPRRPLVLLHGGSGSWTHWVRVIPAFWKSHDVWAADLPGLGDSAMPPEPLIPETCAAIVADGMRTLMPRAPRPHLVGFSFGAHVGSFTAGRLGHAIASFTIVGTSALGLPRPMLDDFPKERSTMTADERREVHRRVLEILMISDPARIDALAVALQQENVGKARFRSRKFAPTDNVARALADVVVPVGSIWGRHDAIAHPDPETCLSVIARHHPDLVHEIIPDAGHWVMFEQAPAFCDALGRVLAVLEAQGAAP